MSNNKEFGFIIRRMKDFKVEYWSVEPLPWASRSSAMPYLPGGGNNQLNSLRVLLTTIDECAGLDTELVKFDDGVARTIKDAVKQVSPAGLVDRVDKGHVAVSREADQWLHTNDPFVLIALFHRRMRFIGELLRELADGAKTSEELRLVASQKYDLPWQTTDQVLRRLMWFSSLGVTEFYTNTSYGLTSLGEDVQKHLVLGFPPRRIDEGKSAEDVDLPAIPESILEVLESLNDAKLSERRASLGYIPRGGGGMDAVQALLNLVNASSPEISRDDLFTFAQNEFRVSASSFSASLTTLTAAGLIEQCGYNRFEPTLIGKSWLESPTAFNLALILHTHFLFVLEIIPLLGEYSRAPELARAAVEHYGFQREDVGGVRTRLQILSAAGLIFEHSNWRYKPTSLGQKVASVFSLQQTEESFAEASREEPCNEISGRRVLGLAEKLIYDLKESATDSAHPDRLEVAVAEVFSALGFETRHIGGSGQTDVLATLDDQDGEIRQVAIDTKAASSGKVLENAISFDTLREHKQKHNADFVVVVGPNFEAGRIQSRAREHGVRLLTTNELAHILQRYSECPISTSVFIDLVTPGDESARRLEARWGQSERQLALIGHIVGALAGEAREKDVVTGGALSASDIYLKLRDEVESKPSISEIKSALDFLSHPFIESVEKRVVGKREDRYFLIDTPRVLTKKLNSLVKSISLVDLEE